MPLSEFAANENKSGRMGALRARHLMLKRRIENEEKNFYVDSVFLKRLKAEKLKIKDEIQQQAAMLKESTTH